MADVLADMRAHIVSRVDPSSRPPVGNDAH
jgi:hypothetical protein